MVVGEGMPSDTENLKRYRPIKEGARTRIGSISPRITVHLLNPNIHESKSWNIQVW